MLNLEVKANFLVQGDGDPTQEAKKLELALRNFLKFYRADSGEVASYDVKVTGQEIHWPR